ncbi:oligosaccharide flippase family protein, partial [bacterium]|nr:oligosaccharide flippase family protein [bacterium]
GLTATVLVTQVILGPLSQACLRHYSPASEDEQLGKYFSALIWIVKRIFGLGAMFIIIAIPLIYFFNGQWLVLTIGSVLFAFIQGLNGVFNNIQNAARQRSIVALHIGGAVWLRLGLALIAIKHFGTTSESTIIGYLLGAFLVLISETFFFNRSIFPASKLRNLGQEPEKFWRRRILDYAWPFATWGIFTFIQQTSDRWALGLIISTSEVGLYTSLFQLSAYPILFLSGIVAQIFEPVIYKRAGDGTQLPRLRSADQLIKWLVIGSLIVSSLLAVGAIFIHEYIFNILVGKEYQSVSYLMPLMIISGGLFVAGQMSTLYLTTRNLTRPLITPKVATAVIGI